jgi:hypothetical protein
MSEAVYEGGHLTPFTLVKGGATTLTAPVDQWFILYWLYAIIITDATVIDRTLWIEHVLTSDADGDGYMFLSLSPIIKSLTKKLVWGQGLQVAATDPAVIAPGQSPLWIPGGQGIKVTGANIQAGDVWRVKGAYRAIPQNRP